MILDFQRGEGCNASGKDGAIMAVSRDGEAAVVGGYPVGEFLGECIGSFPRRRLLESVACRRDRHG